MLYFPVVKLHQCLDGGKSKMSEYPTLSELPLEQGTCDGPSAFLFSTCQICLCCRTVRTAAAATVGRFLSEAS